MAIENKANQDFERAVMKGFWRRVAARLTGKTNELLPYDQVRERIQLKGQHYLGLRQVQIDAIVGSSGRYRDFDRAFLPLQTHTRGRWVSIDKAHYEDVILPPVELYKMGEVYFVKDGNHRVSVAREQGQVFIDAYVIEVEIPVLLTADSKIDDLVVQQEHLLFMEETGLARLIPGAAVQIRQPGRRQLLLEHISVHRWYLGVQRGGEASFEEAVASWYEKVYQPVVQVIREQGLLRDFRDYGEADLYLWIMEYEWYLRRAYREEAAEEPEEQAGKMVADGVQPPLQRLVKVLQRAAWIDDLILQQERAAFYHKSRLHELRPGADVETTVPGQYEKLLEHIDAHRWYLGEQRNVEPAYTDAVVSWYDQVYLPLISIIREQGILEEFPGRTEADLYLWIISHQWYLNQEYGEQVTIEEAAEQFAEEYSQRPVRKLAQVFRRVTPKKAAKGKK